MSNRNGVWSLPAQYQAIADQDWTMAPGAPTGVSATAGNAQAEVSFTAPTFAGIPGTITQFKVTSSSGQTATGSSSPITVTGLTNGNAVTFTAQAQNAIGLGKASDASSSVTPLAEVISGLFSTFLYTGNSSTRTITNDINLSGKGGLVWIKDRDSGSNAHLLYDTARGAYKALKSSSTAAEQTRSTGLTGFTSSGFTLGSLGAENGSSNDKVSWTFREEPKFFDIVTWTGNATARAISHNLGSVPGMVLIKNVSSAYDWQVFHRSLANNQRLELSSTGGKSSSVGWWDQTTPVTSSVLNLGTDDHVNKNGDSFVAYIFAHNNSDGGFGPDSEDIIKCDTYTGNGSTQSITLGFEPQFILLKSADTNSNWVIFDSMRGVVTSSSASDDKYLFPNSDTSEGGGIPMNFTATGFDLANEDTSNKNGDTFIYMAIRRPDQSTQL